MTKKALDAAVAAAKAETKAALQTVYDALNQGQQKKLLKDAGVLALLRRYGLAEEG